MSDPLIQILSDVRDLRSEVAELRAEIVELRSEVNRRRHRSVARIDEARRALILSLWYERVESRVLPTRDVVALGLDGVPTGTLRAVALELDAWSGKTYRAPGAMDCYRLRRANRGGRACWAVERLS